jgi:hypothetical protein
VVLQAPLGEGLFLDLLAFGQDVASLAGLALVTRQSGRWTGKALI